MSPTSYQTAPPRDVKIKISLRAPERQPDTTSGLAVGRPDYRGAAGAPAGGESAAAGRETGDGTQRGSLRTGGLAVRSLTGAACPVASIRSESAVRAACSRAARTASDSAATSRTPGGTGTIR